VLFVARRLWCRIEQGSQPKGRWFKSSPRNHTETTVSQFHRSGNQPIGHYFKRFTAME
jgi:hypothetical protein